MKFRLIAIVVGALAMVSTPVLAQATQSQSSSSEVSRETGQKSDQSELEGKTGIIAAILAGAAVVAGIIIATDDDDDDTPTSP